MEDDPRVDHLTSGKEELVRELFFVKIFINESLLNFFS